MARHFCHWLQAMCLASMPTVSLLVAMGIKWRSGKLSVSLEGPGDRTEKRREEITLVGAGVIG